MHTAEAGTAPAVHDLPNAMLVFEAFEGLGGAALAPVAVGAHEALAADAVPHVLAAAKLPRALGAELVPAGVHLPPVLAGGHVLHPEPVVEDAAEVGGRLGSPGASHLRERDHRGHGQRHQAWGRHPMGGGGPDGPAPLGSGAAVDLGRDFESDLSPHLRYSTLFATKLGVNKGWLFFLAQNCHKKCWEFLSVYLEGRRGSQGPFGVAGALDRCRIPLVPNRWMPQEGFMEVELLENCRYSCLCVAANASSRRL